LEALAEAFIAGLGGEFMLLRYELRWLATPPLLLVLDPPTCAIDPLDRCIDDELLPMAPA
jgi:hypothetical protein